MRGDEKLNVPRYLIIATKQLGLSQDDFMIMNLRKFNALFNAYLEVTGHKKPDANEYAIDSLP